MVSLLLLVTLTLIGVTGMRNASMEERMAGNMRDRSIAFQAAEGAVREGERWLVEETALPDMGNSAAAAPVYGENVALPDLATQTPGWWGNANNTRAATPLQDASGNDLVAQQPSFLLQYEEFLPDTFDVGFTEPTGWHYYRVTGHGTGQSQDARAVIQTTFRKRFN